MFEFATWLQGTALSTQLQNLSLLVPIAQSIHIVAIGLIFMSIVMIVLRVLGWAGHGATVLETDRRFTPWIWGSLVILAITGLLLVISEPVRTLVTTSFWAKMFLLGIGIATAIAFQTSLRRRAPFWEEDARNNGSIRIFGIVTILVWVAIIALGRFIAYDGQIMGPLSIYPF